MSNGCPPPCKGDEVMSASSGLVQVERRSHVARCSKEAVVKVEPMNDGAGVERSTDWVEEEVVLTIGDYGALDGGAECRGLAWDACVAFEVVYHSDLC